MFELAKGVSSLFQAYQLTNLLLFFFIIINLIQFPYVFSTKTRTNRLRSLTHGFMNLVHQNNAENNILSTSGCKDEKAKRWSISSFDRDLDQICWQFDTNGTGVKSYCLYKRQGSLTLYELLHLLCSVLCSILFI